MPPQNKTHEGIDVHASQPMPASGICKCICRCVEKNGNVVAIVPAGFMPSPGLVLANQPTGAVPVFQIFWMEPHEEKETPKMPGNGELRIKNDDVSGIEQ